VARNVGDKSILIQGLGSLAGTYIIEGNFTTAASIAKEGLEAAREIGDFVHEMLSLLILVMTSCLQGDLTKAKGYSFRALAFAEETGASQWLSLVIFAFGLVASFGGQLGLGVRLISTAEALLRQHSIKLGTIGITDIILKQVLEKARAQLGDVAFQVAWDEGQQMTMEQALALAAESVNS